MMVRELGTPPRSWVVMSTLEADIGLHIRLIRTSCLLVSFRETWVHPWNVQQSILMGTSRAAASSHSPACLRGAAHRTSSLAESRPSRSRSCCCSRARK
jgi:hypothetical protein